MFEHYTLLEQDAIILEGWIIRRQFGDPIVTSSSIHTLVFGEKDFSNYVIN
jgi:hypothetical protein